MVLFWFCKDGSARGCVPFWDAGHRYSTGVDRMNKWRLDVPGRNLLSAGAGEIDGMKHLARGGGMPLTLYEVDTRSMPYG